MLARHNEVERGLHPVATGEASWLPAQFREAMREVEAAIARENQIAADRIKAKGRP